jgi:transporter family-2 protein
VELLAIPFLLAVGGLLSLQAAANVQLSAAAGSPVGGATLQLGIGAGLLLAAAAAAGTLGAVRLVPDVEPWRLVGGLGSSVYITAGILLFPRLGAVVAVGLFIAGQMIGSLALDGFGWLGVDREPLTGAALLGGAAVVAGGALIVKAAGDAAESSLRRRAGWVAVALLAGAVLPVQGAVNAQLRADLDAPATVGALSFVVATGAMALLLAGSLALGAAPSPRFGPLRRVPWWGWLGGLCGATYVTSVFLLIPEIGTAATIGLTVAGQQLASLFVDRYGLLRLPRRPLSTVRLAGVATLLVGVALIQTS